MTKRPQTIYNKTDDGCSKDQKEQCDYKYLARIWFFRTVAIFIGTIFVSSCLGVWYTVDWKKEQEYKVADLDKRVTSVEKIQNDLDTIKVLLRKIGE